MPKEENRIEVTVHVNGRTYKNAMRLDEKGNTLGDRHFLSFILAVVRTMRLKENVELDPEGVIFTGLERNNPYAKRTPKI